jgi:cytochrome c biogenesis factor
MSDYICIVLYMISCVLFIMGIKKLGKADTARKGNLYSSVGMLIAVVTVLLEKNVTDTLTEGVMGNAYIWSIAAIALGGIIGAIWANVSWGTYWSWDPKETWALITFMVYAISLHTNSIKGLRKPLNYHIFMTLAFLTILMTYFGVNYILGGMHSYA